MTLVALYLRLVVFQILTGLDQVLCSLLDSFCVLRTINRLYVVPTCRLDLASPKGLRLPRTFSKRTLILVIITSLRTGIRLCLLHEALLRVDLLLALFLFLVEPLMLLRTGLLEKELG